MVDNTHHTTRIKTVGRGFSPTSALKTPQYTDVANNKGAGFKDFVGLKTDLHHHVPRTTHHTPNRRSSIYGDIIKHNIHFQLA